MSLITEKMGQHKGKIKVVRLAKQSDSSYFKMSVYTQIQLLFVIIAFCNFFDLSFYSSLLIDIVYCRMCEEHVYDKWNKIYRKAPVGCD